MTEKEFIKQEVEIDYAEIYRQDYLDALDTIRNLKLTISDLEKEKQGLKYEIEILTKQLDNAERYIINNVNDEIIY